MPDFIIQGARGTLPATGRRYLKYGGNTTCYSIRTDKGIITFDAGTGISHVAEEIAGLSKTLPLTLFFTHFHMDHIIGFPCFDPVYVKNKRITIMADPRRHDNWKSTLKTFMDKPYWPIGLGETAANMTLKDIPVRHDAMEVYGVRISWFSVPHPQSCLAYRIETQTNTIVIATDVEYDPDAISTGFIDFCRGADFLVYDAQFTPEEYVTHRGWGHSSWQTGTRIASNAGVGRLILTHHAPTRADRELEQILSKARHEFACTSIAREGMVLSKKP